MPRAVPVAEGPEEIRAAKIVEARSACSARRLDVGGGAQCPDYALVGPDGEDIGLLEVTSITPQRYVSFWSTRTRPYRNWRLPGLKRNWKLSLADARSNLKPLRKVAEPLLLGRFRLLSG